MAKISILSENVASKIAAGEVIQRPESVIKELLENSLDSGAKNITLIIKNAGKNLIQVSDDGCGMSTEDALLSLKRHSTSKIKEITDLERLNTFGFRGEALYSISSVSRFELKTKDEASEIGTKITVEGTGNIDFSAINCEKGTTVTVKNLFFNIPARRKFLKSNATEYKHIFETWQRMTIAHPDIRFVLIEEDVVTFDLLPSSLEKRLQTFYGNNFLNNLISINRSSDSLSIFGYLGTPFLSKKSRGDQFIFLNHRYVINKAVNHTIYRAYEHLLEKGDYPFFCVFIEIDPQKIDVNVHPSKLEVKFDDEHIIYSAIYNAVKDALSNISLTPTISLIPDSELSDKTRLNQSDFQLKDSSFDKGLNIFQTTNKKKDNFSEKAKTGSEFVSNKYIDSNKTTDNYFKAITGHESFGESSEPEKFISQRVVWQLHNKYILTPVKNGLLMIDQHVAHERIIYEKAVNSYEINLPLSQQLLFANEIELSPPDYKLVMELYDYLDKLGFEIIPGNKYTITVKSIPQEIKLGTEKYILLEILELYREYASLQISDAKDNLAKSFACKAAVKAGDPLTEREMLSLIDNLFACKIPNVCPHGRPVMIKLSIDELDRRFGRTVQDYF